jgi:phosphoenolpyruvate-protein phosphotransferase (PTS system enzyme I)
MIDRSSGDRRNFRFIPPSFFKKPIKGLIAFEKNGFGPFHAKISSVGITNLWLDKGTHEALTASNNKLMNEIEMKIVGGDELKISLGRIFAGTGIRVGLVKHVQGERYDLYLLSKTSRPSLRQLAGLKLVAPVVSPEASKAIAVEGRAGLVIDKKPLTPSDVLTGRAVSHFIGIGRAFVPTKPDISKFLSELIGGKEFSQITSEDIQSEMNSARVAFVTARAIYEKNLASSMEEDREIATKMIGVIDDYSPRILGFISDQKMNFKMACVETFSRCEKLMEMEGLDEKTMNSMEDMIGLRDKLILAFHDQIPDLFDGVESVCSRFPGEKIIPICHRVDYSEVESLVGSPLVGGCVEAKGGLNSHTTISCKSHRVPLVIGVENATEKISDGDLVIVDGQKGKVFVNPASDVVAKYEKIKDVNERLYEAMQVKYSGQETVKTLDGVGICVAGNAASFAEVAMLKAAGIKKIGLFRTEQFMENVLVQGKIVKRTCPPTIDEIAQYFKAIFEEFGVDNEIVIRLMDINGDKYLSYLDKPHADLLGTTKEGTALFLDKENHKAYHDLAKDLTKGILMGAQMAERKAPLAIEFPMIMSLNQFKEAKKFVKTCMEEMVQDGVEHLKNVHYYSMVEHPQLGPYLDDLTKVADGLSLGTNDLVMKMLFSTRYSAYSSDESLHPNVLSFIKRTSDVAKKYGKPLFVCGAMGSDPVSIPPLIGSGITGFSSDMGAANFIKSIASNVDTLRCASLVASLSECASGELARKEAIRSIWNNMMHGERPWKGLEEVKDLLSIFLD